MSDDTARRMIEQSARAICRQSNIDDGYSDSPTLHLSIDQGMWKNHADQAREGLLNALRALAEAGPSGGMERAGYERISEGMEAGRIVTPGEVWRVMCFTLIAEVEQAGKERR